MHSVRLAVAALFAWLWLVLLCYERKIRVAGADLV